jgi:transcriptional regulator with XRE-family HTH domain
MSSKKTQMQKTMTDSSNKMPANVGYILSKLRKDANLKQSEVAKKLTVNPSKVSRVESGEVSITNEEVKAILEAINTKEAKEFNCFLNQSWEYLERPYFFHPDREILYVVECTLKDLENLCNKENFSNLLYGTVKMYKDSLVESAEYLMSLHHSIAYIGVIGIGKTTAVCVQTGLTFPESEQSNKINTVLEVGKGGTTICEVRVKEGFQYSLGIEPMDDTEIYRLARELCVSLYEDEKGAEKSSSGIDNQLQGVSIEIGRALRNMTDLLRERRRDDDGKLHIIDPLKQLADQSKTLDVFCSEFNKKLELWNRKRREIIYSQENELSELEWLSNIFVDINNGRNKEFSLPKRIDISVPFNTLNIPDYEVEIIDTKGIDQTAIRPDLQSFIEDPRTIVFLCSRFEDAFSVSSQSIIEHLKKIGQLDNLKEKIALLVLPRNDEALDMKDDSKIKAETREDGYDMKLEQIETLLRRMSMADIPVVFFDSFKDEPEKLNYIITKKLKELRNKRIHRINVIKDNVKYLHENLEKEYVKASQNKVKKQLEIFLERNPNLPNLDWKIHKYLIDETRKTHQRTIWASVNRQGVWGNFNVYFILGCGAIEKAHEETKEIYYGFQEIIKQMIADSELKPSHGFLRELSTNSSIWYKNFLKKIEIRGSQIFRNSLDSASVWQDCADLYGKGLRFREEMIKVLQCWFEQEEHKHLFESLENQVNKHWHEEFLGNIKSLVDGQ